MTPTLTNPNLDYGGVRDAVLALLQANMAALNVGLAGGTFTDAAQQIISGYPLVTPVMDTLYPVIMVKVINKHEQFLNIGAAGRKRPVVMFRIFGITSNMASDVDKEIMQLTKNIEGLFRNNIDISGNVLMSSLGTADFGMLQNDSAWVHIVAIDLECTVELS